MRHWRAVGPLAFAAATLLASTASAQPRGATGSLERFQPSDAGDAMFGVPSPAIGGHLVPRAFALFDFGYRPLSVQEGNTRRVIVSHQLFLHLNASFALFDRILVSADMPFALAQGGDSPTLAGSRFPSPDKAQVGDLRLGARVRIYGDYWDPFQIGVGGYIHTPTAPARSYAGDGAVRGVPLLLVGGRLKYFVYSFSAGTTIRAGARPHTFDLRTGAAVVLADERVQLGPEVSIAAPFSKEVLTTETARITVASPVAAELLLGAKFRPVRPLVLGVAAGPGLTNGWGTPVFSAVGSIGYDPLPPRPGKADGDGDGIVDPEDACPTVRGVKSDDPKKNGCPPDTDGDGIVDLEDACPTVPGVKSDDPKKNGCPPDSDGDSIPDPEDACPKEPGPRSDDPKKNGCPVPPDPDTDGDGILDPVDACPKVRGVPDPDPKKNGCPVVEVTPTEIVIRRQVQFRFGRSTIDQTVDPVSDDLLGEVRDAIVQHPEIELIEVQGHADNVGVEAFNHQLSTARANAVRKWLVDRGIPGNKLEAKGYGSTQPLASNVSEAGRQENRRVQFVIRKKKGAP
jgi:OOP family OmpA-OmpF porin